MKKIGLLIGLLLFAGLQWLQAKSPEIHSFYQHDKFVIDGKIDEWGDMAIYDEKTSIISNVSNDHEYIYIKIRITNYTAIYRMQMGGFTIWFNDEGKVKRKKGIVFPTNTELSKDLAEKQRKLKGLSKEQIQRMQEQNKNEFNKKFASGLAAINVVNADLEIIDSKSFSINESGLSATIRLMDFDLLFYEARIPLNMVFENKDEFLGSKKKAFSMGFEFGKYEDKELKKQAATIPNDSRYRGNPYYSRYQSRMEGYGTFPPIDTWYKRVYLSTE